ncbi:hypothetical protein IAI10_19630 [Clostridium sp. 19966]|uniref:hypothetical protein n=1 Tax=Clostridium sp. 19966 TaxID=2768166 RepID=UPI0028DDE5A6|nr:hypothetical protein [Clostridium sp. 19966]MDT8718869.1 hypothetical protein [Clostridium sp. 19966]
MKRILLLTVIVIFNLSIFTSFSYIKEEEAYGIMTIVLNEGRVTHYYKYNLINKKYKEIYKKADNDYSCGKITKDCKTLYFTHKGDDKQNELYKFDIASSRISKVTKDLKVDIFDIGRDKIFLRCREKKHKNNNLAILKLPSNSIKICNEEELDSDIYHLQYNSFNHKLYTIERSKKELLEANLSKLPTHKIVQYNEEGEKEKELFEIKGFIKRSSVSKDGSRALVSVSFGPFDYKIYLIDFEKRQQSVVLESTNSLKISKALFSPKEKGFYFLGSNKEFKIIDENAQQIVRSNAVFYYDFSTKKISEAFYEASGFINEFTIAY